MCNLLFVVEKMLLDLFVLFLIRIDLYVVVSVEGVRILSLLLFSRWVVFRLVGVIVGILSLSVIMYLVL